MAFSRIMGGMFGLELGPGAAASPPELPPPFLRGPHLLLTTARSAFTLLHRALQPAQVWLPSYLCGVIIPSFSAPATTIRFYSVDECLRIMDDRWLSEVHSGDIVVFNDYFGFNFWEQWGEVARRLGAWVVEDASQALLNDHFSQHAHYVVFSPRKFVGVPDGGVLLAQGDTGLPRIDLAAPPAEWWQNALNASVRRAEFDRHEGSEDQSWFTLFQKVESGGPTEPCAMSELSGLMLRYGVAWGDLERRRRENYRHLAAALGNFAIFPDLRDGVVPLGFPIRLANRDAVRQALFAKEIYPPVHWPIAGVVPAEFAASHQLAREIMTLPCDQRCSCEDLDRTLAVLQKMRGKPASNPRETARLFGQ